MGQGSWIKEGACVIDVGINAVPDDSNPRGYRLVGDVDFEVRREGVDVDGGWGEILT